jgi:hypothetical protein
MKLKKDHIPGLGDNLDFCIVGAGFDADYARDGGKAQQGQKWNTWHVGCLENKSDVLEDVHLDLCLLTLERSTTLLGIIYGGI